MENSTVFLNILVFLVSIGLLVHLFFKKRFNYWKSLGIPSDEITSPLGHLKGIGKTKHLSEVVADCYYKYRQAAPVFGMYFSIKPLLVVHDLDLIKAILVKDFNNFENRGVYFNEKEDPLSAHLFAIEGQKWKTLRQTITPTFTSGKIKLMFPTIMIVGDRFQKKMIEVVRQNNEVEIKDWIARFTTDVIGICAFGLDCNCVTEPNAMFRIMGRKVFEKQRHSPATLFLMDNYRSIAKVLGLKRIQDDVSQFFRKVVNDTIQYRTNNGIKNQDFIDLLMNIKSSGNLRNGVKSLTDEDIQAQAFIFFLAGFEASSTVLTFCIYELCLNQDIQEKARQSIMDTLAKHNNDFCYEFVHDLKYIECLLNEAMRKYPPAILLIRFCKNDYKIPGTKLYIPGGVKCLVPIHTIQNDHQIYPNPEKFDPERFTEEEVAKRHHFTHLPFGEGPRNCIAMRFGMLQAKIGLTLLLQKFRFQLSPKVKTPIQFDPKSNIPNNKGGMYVIMEEI